MRVSCYDSFKIFAKCFNNVDNFSRCSLAITAISFHLLATEREMDTNFGRFVLHVHQQLAVLNVDCVSSLGNDKSMCRANGSRPPFFFSVCVCVEK